LNWFDILILKIKFYKIKNIILIYYLKIYVDKKTWIVDRPSITLVQVMLYINILLLIKLDKGLQSNTITNTIVKSRVIE
jgi:hypothetical protein